MNSSERFKRQGSLVILSIAVGGIAQIIVFFGVAVAQKQTNVFTTQFWQSITTIASSQLTFCSNVTKYNVRRKLTIAKMFQEQVWSDNGLPVLWQFCALTPQGFESWKQGWERAFQSKKVQNVSIKTYPQPWRNWAYCGSCSVQMYVVQQMQTKQEFLIEFYSFWESKDDMVVSRTIPGGFIRVARFR